MAFLTPIITQLSPPPPVILTFPAGGMQGSSAPQTLSANVQSPAGVGLPINGKAVLTIINADQYHFDDDSKEKRIDFLQQIASQPIQFIFIIRNVHALAPSPAPLLLTVCTFDVLDGEGSKKCNSRNFEVKAAAPLAKVKFLGKKRRK